LIPEKDNNIELKLFEYNTSTNSFNISLTIKNISDESNQFPFASVSTKQEDGSYLIQMSNVECQYILKTIDQTNYCYLQITLKDDPTKVIEIPSSMFTF